MMTRAPEAGSTISWAVGLQSPAIATTRINDHRKARTEDSPTFNVNY
jgi:hypothetical protein